MSRYNQKTINNTIKLYGIGLHNGNKANLIIDCDNLNKNETNVSPKNA